MNSASLEPVGMIGLGAMGEGIGRRILGAGRPLTVFVRSAQAAVSWAGAGADIAASPRLLAQAGSVVILSLPDDAAVDAVLEGPDGLAAGLRRAACVIDTSTVSPAGARRRAAMLAQQDVAYLDAPVSGGQQGARDGTLVAMVGGDAAACEAARPLAALFCSAFTHVGGSGAGQVLKACNQVAVAGALLGVAEALALAAANGLDLAVAREVMLGGSARSFALERHGQRLIDADFAPGFRAALMHKDLRLAAEAADQAGVDLEAARLALQRLQALCEAGQDGCDWSAIGRFDKLMRTERHLDS